MISRHTSHALLQYAIFFKKIWQYWGWAAELESGYKNYFPAAGRWHLPKYSGLPFSKTGWRERHGDTEKACKTWDETVLPPFSQTSGTPYYACVRCFKSKRNESMEIEIEIETLDDAAASSFCCYINTSSRGWSVASYTNILSFTFPKRTPFPGMEIKTQGTTVHVESPASVFSLQNFLPKVRVKFCMDLRIFTTLKQADDILMDTKKSVYEN